MRALPLRASIAALALLVLLVPRAEAGDVEIAPFAGVQFGGTFELASSSVRSSIENGLDYGGTIDVAVSQGWRVELLYSRQSTELSGTGALPRFGLTVERYMAGIQEEKGQGKTRYFGVFLLGLTRFAPELGALEADERFTFGLSLGLKTFFSDNFGVRLEGRAFLVTVESGGGVFCSSGVCLFRYRASGMWQGDLSAAAVLKF